ncbi:MAG: hypothetical protein IPL98_16395 [Saprospiraceae bacterium]|nr:hypothetical protein [Saprospiraceae bacterium]
MGTTAIGSGINSSRITTQPKDTTIYTVKFTNEYGCEFIDSFMVVISRFYPPLNAYVDDDTIYLGQALNSMLNQAIQIMNGLIHIGYHVLIVLIP